MTEVQIVARLIGGLLLTVCSVALLLTMAVLSLLILRPRAATKSVLDAWEIVVAYGNFVRAVFRRVTQ